MEARPVGLGGKRNPDGEVMVAPRSRVVSQAQSLHFTRQAGVSEE